MRDVDLVKRARGGDADAFDALVRGGLDRSYRLATAILGNEQDARDAVQDAYLAAWQDLPSLRDPERFEGWLSRVVVNVCRMQLRRRGSIREIRLASPTDSLQLPDPHPESDPERVDEADSVDRAFARLSLDARCLLVLHHLEERPVHDIARVMGIPSGTVKWRLYRARGAFERALAEERR